MGFGLTVPGAVHFGLALVALGLGLWILRQRKGTPVHRRAGRWWVAAMVALNVAGFFVHEDRVGYGPFHLLAVVSVLTLAGGIGVLKIGEVTVGRRVAHGYMMSWAYAGLVAAGLGQLGAALDGPVWPMIGGSLVVAVVLIHTGRVERALPGFPGRARR